MITIKENIVSEYTKGFKDGVLSKSDDFINGMYIGAFISFAVLMFIIIIAAPV